MTDLFVLVRALNLKKDNFSQKLWVNHSLEKILVQSCICVEYHGEVVQGGMELRFHFITRLSWSSKEGTDTISIAGTENSHFPKFVGEDNFYKKTIHCQARGV